MAYEFQEQEYRLACCIGTVSWQLAVGSWQLAVGSWQKPNHIIANYKYFFTADHKFFAVLD